MSNGSPDGSEALYREAISRLQDALERAGRTDTPEPTAMTMACTLPDGWPSARTVLLKGLDERGAVFYTNRHSRKGQALEADPRVALSFHWQTLAEQAHIIGVAVPVSDDEADAYWASRPRISRLGGWASQQSRILDDPEALQQRLAHYDREFPDEVPRPPHWSGYCVVPRSIELWKSGEGRLHQRERYFQDATGWHHVFLNP